MYPACLIYTVAFLPTKSVRPELSESEHVQIVDYIDRGHAGQHLLHARGGQPLPLHDHQQGGPGLRLQHGGGQAEHQPGGLR